MNGFESLGSDITDFLSSQGIVTPSPIQVEAIPKILDERDVLLLAPTGSGKTEAALLPLIHRLNERKKQKELFGFYILYITPLRALNRDVFKRIKDLCQHLGLTVDVRHGDTTQYARRKQAITPPNLLVTTPETLQAILPGKRLKYHLRTVFAVIVDEVHELADSKRGVQLSLGLERLEKLIGSSFQRIGLSATVGNPKEVSLLLGGVGRQVDIIWAGYESSKIEMRVECPSPTPEQIKLASKISYPAYSTARLERITQLIEEHDTTLVFVNTRSFAEVLGSKMIAIKPPFEFDVHHGSLSKEVRTTAEDRLKRGISKAIVATSSLELGIDIGKADLVVQYSSPRMVSRALQRVGRAGHGIGRVSEGVLLATSNLDDITESGVILRRARQNKVERASIARNAWDVLSHQVSGLILDLGEIETDELYQMVISAYPFSEVTRTELASLLDFMRERKIINLELGKVKWGPRTRSFYYENLSTIPDSHQVTALDISTQSPIGVLDEDYVSQHLEVGHVFVIRGRPWHVVSIENEEVVCAPASGTDSEAPRWIGSMIPVPYEVAVEVADLWNMIVNSDEKSRKKLLKQRYGIMDEAHDQVIETLENSVKVLSNLPSSKRIVIEDFGNGIVLHSPFGTKANETLGIVLAALLTTRMGIDVGVEKDPYRILLVSEERIDPEVIVQTLREYNGLQISTLLRLAIKRTQTFASRFIHVGRRMSIIRKEAKTKEIPVKWLISSVENTPVFEEAMQEVLRDKLEEHRVLEIINEISRDEIELCIVETENPSPLARLVIEERTRFEVMGEISDEDEVLRLMEDRLLAKRFHLVCMTKGDWSSNRTLRTLDDDITCPICGSRRIAATYLSDSKLLKIVKGKIRGSMTSPEDEKAFRNAALIASLVSTYGKRALIVLAGRGIGPQTASRILRPGQDRLSLLKEIAKAEKDYARTRAFWD